MLQQSLAGIDEQMVRTFEELVQAVPTGSPVRARALIALAEAHQALGQSEDARAALRECVRTGPGRQPCLQRLGQLELEHGAVRELPVHWTFDSADHGLVHPWRYASRGSVRLEPREGDFALAWTTMVEAQSDDILVLRFDDPQPVPTGIRLSVQATAFDAQLRMIAFDVYGERFTHGQISVPVTSDTRVEVRLDSFLVAGPGQTSLDPANLYELVLQDVTGYVSRSRGSNTLLIDDFEVF